MKPTLVHIFHALVPVKYLAGKLAEAHPAHREAVDHFIREITQITDDLQAAVYGSKSDNEEP